MNVFIDLNKFQLLNLIGKGESGEVFQVKKIDTNELYAAKILKHAINWDSISKEESIIFTRTINLMKSIDNPTLLQYIGFSPTDFEQSPNPTIISKFMPKKSLYDIIKSEPHDESISDWTETKKLINIYGIASSLHYLHSINIIHQDLKPENILIDDKLFPKTSDFGLLQITSSISKSGFKGTPNYMAPELFQDASYSQSSDVYAFSIIVYEILTGTIPFEKLDFNSIKEKVVNQKVRPEFASDIPSAYQELIEKCWSQNPKDRPTFDDIIMSLKSDEKFISDFIDREEFYEYVDYIDNYRPSKPDRMIINVNDVKEMNKKPKQTESVEKEENQPKKNFFGRTIVEKEPFEINSQGCLLRGFFLRPIKAGKLPTVIVSHGFGSCTRETKKYARVFVDEGYAAVCFDFCMSGSGKSTGSSLGMSVLTEKVDLLNLLDYVKTLDFVDHSRISLVGLSQGGFVSALAAVERESEVERLIMYYPALCIPDDARRGQMINAKFDPENVPDQLRALFVKLSSKYVLDVIKMDPYKEICGFKKPVLIIHGTKDRLVNISYSRRASEEYPNCKLVEVNGDHGFIFHGFSQSKQATIEYLHEI